MGTTSGHQLSTFSSPVNNTSPIDANTVRGNDNTIKTSYNSHDSDVTIHLQSGAVASRPAASTAQQTWLATDTGAVYLWLDTGSAWVEVNYLRNTGGSITGAVTITTTTTPQLTLAYDGTHTSTFSVSSAGALTINATSTVTITPATTLSAALTYGGVTLSNAVTGTGNMVLSASPTFTGTAAFATVTTSSTINGQTISSAASFTGTLGVTGTLTTGSGSGETLSSGSLSVGKDIGLASTQGLVSGGTRFLYYTTGTTTTTIASATTAVQALTAVSGAFDRALANTASVFVDNGADDKPMVAFRRGGTVRSYLRLNTDNDFRLLASDLTTPSALTVGAITATTATLSTTTAITLALRGAGTGAQVIDGQNTGGRFQLGLESSAGGGNLPGTSAYATTLLTTGATQLYLGTNGAVGMTMATNQAVTFAASLTVTGLIQNTLTTEQMRLRYDSTHYVSTTVDSSGNVTKNIVGAGGITHSFACNGTTAVTFNETTFSVVGTLVSPASTTSAAGFRITAGVAPTSPANGDMWQDGTNVKIRVGGVTKTFTIT